MALINHHKELTAEQGFKRITPRLEAFFFLQTELLLLNDHNNEQDTPFSLLVSVSTQTIP